LSLGAQNYLTTLRNFERLWQMYKSGKAKRNSATYAQLKFPLETFALYAKKELIVLASIAHNRTNKTVYDVM